MNVLPERFLDKVRPNIHGCWEWTASSTGNGYGQFWSGGKLVLAHRFAYSRVVSPIAAGLEVDHLCNNTWCVHPAHLEAVTQAENIRRSEGVGPKNSRKTHCDSGHPFTEENTYHYPRENHRECRVCKRSRDRRYYHAARATE